MRMKRGKFQEEKYAPVIFGEFFGNSNPVEFEIGCGKGKFLVARAIANPGTNFKIPKKTALALAPAPMPRPCPGYLP